ncbi:U4/U6 small nuclear ribonucleoprotein Prp3 [Cichlidogyrus casuarinus]|uniref:U4/U6 small nuclear ribonucleoprotein Prp3 n=1 Tax=Cichlidogyrus casuarinus TaxID=1844966 RepID=A0ABD2Q1K9_9PLAT
MTKYTPTLKANIRAKNTQHFKQILNSTEHKKKPVVDKTTTFYDPRISTKSVARPHRNLNFHEPGKFIKQGNQLRIKAQLERLQQSVSQAAKKTGIASAAKLATIQPKSKSDETQLPDIEWWDNYIMRDEMETYAYVEKAQANNEPISCVINEAWITRLIEHPISMKPPTYVNKPPELPLLLTKKEQKKLRRQNRMQTQKETQEQVRLGLVPAPEPKVKLSNLMRVLGTSAVQDPSKMEAYVRNQMDARKRAHEKLNADRKLTKEQARYKKIRKIKEDTSLRVHVAVYRVKDLSNLSHRFKVETNANQLLMTGIVALHNNCNVIVVEGGRKQQHKFKRLMLHRIKWNESVKRKIEEETPSSTQNPQGEDLCQLIWEGTVKERAFEKVQLKPCPTELYAREIFKKKDVEHYWDAAYATAVLEETSKS